MDSSKVCIHLFNHQDAMASAIYGMQDIFKVANQFCEEPFFDYVSFSESQPFKPNNSKLNFIFIPPSLAKPKLSNFDPSIVNMLRKECEQGAIAIAACTGVFWLAEAGLLKNKCVTTHWLLCDQLADQFPEIRAVYQHQMVVDQGNVITAAGVYAFQDLALHLIARYRGMNVAKQVADFCLLDLSGRLQSYYQRFTPSLKHDDQAILKVQRHLEKTIDKNLSNYELAKLVGLSERTFLRRFKLVTHITPKQYQLQMKVEKAKQLIEFGTISVDQICDEVGYSDPSNFSKIFKKVAGVSIAEFKKRHTDKA